MDFNQILYTIILVVLSFLISYYKANSKFRTFVAALVNDAASLDITGQEKKDWVVNQLYAIIPAWLKVVLTKPLLGMIVQQCFDSMKQFAAKYVDKVLDKAIEALPVATLETAKEALPVEESSK